MDRDTATTVELLTIEQFREMPEENEFRTELVQGRLVREPRPGARHGLVLGRLYYALETYARETKNGMVVVEAGFVLEESPATVRGPDVAFIVSDRLPVEGVPVGFWELGPDLAVEVVSPSNTAAGIQAKVLEYLGAGTRLVWVVDPETESVTVYRSRKDVRVLTRGDELGGAEVVPGFRLELEALFGSSG